MSLIKSFSATIDLTQGPLLQIFPVPTILDRTDVVQDYKVISLVAEEAWLITLTVKNNDVLVDLSTPALSLNKMRISVWDNEDVDPVDLAITTEAASDLANGIIVFKCPKDAIDPLWANDFDRIPAGRITIDFQLENSEGPTYFYDRINIIDSNYGGTGNVAPNSKNYLEAADVKSRALAGAGYTVPTGASDLAQMQYVDDQIATIDLAAHEADLANPHVVTATQVGNTTAQWNADKIEGIATALSGISNGEIVGYNGTNFVPVTASALPAGTTGDILINNAGTYEVLLPGANGTVLQSNGSLSLPTYEALTGTGDVVGPASAVSGNIPSYDGVTGKLMDDSGVVAAEVVQRGDVIATATDEVQLGVKGASGQTANIFEVQDSGAVVLAGFDKDGTVFSEIVETNDHQLLAEVAAPSTPATDKVALYAKADGLLYSKDDAGVETLVSSGTAAGDVVGPASATDNAIPRYDATTGKLLQDSGVTIDDAEIVSGATEVNINGIGTYYKAAHTGATGMVNGGGILSINADPTKFDLTAGSGYVVDIFTDPANPNIIAVAWTAFTAEASTYVATDNLSWVLIDNVGAIVQQNTEPTREQHRTHLIVGVLVHPSTSISATADQSHSIDTYLAEDLANVLGNINISGNNFNPASTDLTVRRESGVSFCPNGNRSVNPKDPNSCTSSADVALTFIYAYNDGAGGITAVTGQTDIDPDFYDDGSGTLVALANNKWTNQTCYFNPSSGVSVIRYGEVIYSSKAEAVDAEENIPTTIGTGLGADLIRTVISVKKGETDISSANTNYHVTGRFGLGAGGGSEGGSVTDTDAVHVNVAGEIAAIANKATAVAADKILIEDSADSNNKKHVLASQFLAGSGDVSASAVLADNALIRGDGGAKGVQDSGILIDDSDNMSGVNDLDILGGFKMANNKAFSIADSGATYRTVFTLSAGDVLRLTNNSLGAGGAMEFRTQAGGGTSLSISSAGDFDFNGGDFDNVNSIEVGGVDLQTYVAAGTDNNQTGTAYTLVLADQENKTVWMSNASANECTIPTNASVAFPIGTKINIMMEGAGVTTVAAVSSTVTLNGVTDGSHVINNQYQGATLTKRGTDTWILAGDIT